MPKGRFHKNPALRRFFCFIAVSNESTFLKHSFYRLPQVKRRIMDVVRIPLVLGQRIAVPLISEHDVFGTVDCSLYIGQTQFTEASLEIGLFLVLLHAFKDGGEGGVEVPEIAVHIGQLSIAAALMEDHPKIEAQVAVAPLIGDRLSQFLYILKAADGRLNPLDLFSLPPSMSERCQTVVLE